MHRLVAAFVLLLPACYSYQAPPPAEPRDETPVDASMGQTWDAVIDLFAARNIPIRTIERASGIITTEGLTVDPEAAEEWAQCGSKGDIQYRPNMAIYNVLVRGDSSKSTVRATVRWSHFTLKDGSLECTSTYVYERELEEGVKSRAEEAYRAAGRRVASSSPSAGSESDPPAASGSAPPRRSSKAAASEEPVILPPRQRRSSGELMESLSFRLAITDLQRTKVVNGFRELRLDTLTVYLHDATLPSSSTEYRLQRLYLAYRGTTNYSPNGALELRHEGKRLGLYTQRGLLWEGVR